MKKTINLKNAAGKGPELLTGGNPWRRIVLFSLPLLGGEICHLLYAMTDAFILGRVLGITALAATGAVLSLVSLVFGIAMGLSSGFTVITAQRIGSGDEPGIRRSVAAGVSLSLVLGLVFTVVLVPLTRPVLLLMNTPPEILGDAAAYASIIIGGIAVSMFNNLFCGLIQAAGDSATPLAFLIASTVLNILLDLLLVAVIPWGVRGAAIATVFSQLVSAALALRVFLKRFGDFLPRRGEWYAGRKELAAHFSLGISMALQRIIVEFGNILVQTVMNSLGTVTIGAVAAAQRIRALNMMPFFALSRAVTTYTAQNYGAGRMDRVNRGIFQSCLLCLGGGLCMALLNRVGGRFFASLFITDSAEGIALAYRYIIFSGYTVTILGLMLTFRSCLQGLGKRFAPVMCGVMETVMSVLAAFVLIPRIGFLGVCLVNPLSWLASLFPVFLGFMRIRKGEGPAQPSCRSKIRTS
jgi:putative MATE family efflux protein